MSSEQKYKNNKEKKKTETQRGVEMFSVDSLTKRTERERKRWGGGLGEC